MAKKKAIMRKVFCFSIFLVILMNCLTPCIAVNNSTENNASPICVDENNVTTVTIPLSLPSPTPLQFKVDQFISANATNHVHHITTLTQSSKSKWDKNGHYYEIIKKDVDWNEAKEYTEKQEFEEESTGVVYEGYLAIITSPEENSWIVKNILSAISTSNICLWLGGYQLEGYDNPAECWRWITGEDWSWTNWNKGEPNDVSGYNERYLEMYAWSGKWNDESCDGCEKWTNYILIEYKEIKKADLILLSSDISFSNPNPALGETVTIAASIHNIGDANAKDVVVQFFDNDMQIRSDQTISTVNASGTGTAQVNWTAISGSRNISVIVDPESVIAEGNETNNIAFKTINISVPRKLNVNIIEPINYSVYSVGDPVQFNITVSDLNDSLLSSGISAYAVLTGPDNASKIIPFSIDGNFFVGEYSISSDDSKGVWVANVTAYNSTHSGLSTSIIIFTSPYTIHVKSDKASYVLGEVVAFNAEAYRLGVSGGVLTGSDVCLNLSIYDKDFTLVYGPESMSYDNFSQSFISHVDTDLLGKGWFNVSVAGEDASGNLANTTTDFFVADDFEVHVSTDKSIYDRGESVNISGAAVFGDGSAVDNATVSIAINVKGFTRTFVTDTNDDGEFNYTFNPFTYEAGNYNLTVTVDYWGLERAEEADFSITGLYLRPESETLDMAENSVYVFNLTLFNLGESTLTGITASLVDRNATDNVFGVLDTSTLPDMLLPGENRSFALVVEASEDALGESEFSVVVSSVQTSDGVSEILVRIHPNKPVLDVIPGKVEAGLNLNHSTVKSFTISNSGYGTLRNVTLNQPSNPWLQIISDERVGDIPPGVNVSINFVISSFHVGLGEYSEAVNISSDNYETVSVEVTVHVTDSSTGSLLFYVGDVLERNVSNASVYLINYDTYDEFISLTNTTGYVLLENLPIGRYTYEVSSKDTGHFPQTGTVIVEPMENPKLVEVMLYLSFVDFEWEVIPTAIKDRYIIRLNLTFETDIQIPILVAYPPFLNYNLAPGETVQDSITLYNIGLISLYDVTISPPNFGDGVEIDFPLGQKVPEIKAKERVEVPFTIRLSDTASECKKYKGKISATGSFIHFINSKQVEGTAGTSIPLTIRTPCAQHDVPLPDIPSPCFFIGLPFLGEFHTGPCIDVDGISSYNNYRSDSAVIWILSVTDCEGETLEIFTKELIATNCNHKGINLFPKVWGVSKDCSISPISFSFLDASLIEGVDEFWYGTWTCPSTSDGLRCNIFPNEVAKLDVHHIGISKGVGFSPINFVGGMLFFFYGYDTPICPGLVPIIGMSFNELCIPQVGPIKPIDYRIDWPFWGPYPDWRGDIPFPWRDFSIDIRINPPGLPGVPTPPPPPKMPKPPLISDTIHEIVKLYISQEATMERDAFYAGLSMYNKMGDKDISSMKINLKITDSNNSANDLFFIRSPRLVGIGDVSGSGTLGPLSRANIQWLIIPKPGAGGTDPEGTVYNISAEISYSVEGQNFKFRTQQAQITVKPQPQIVLDYYIPSDVVANIPFKLAVKATNEGYSTARNFEIETAQPVIYDNVAGLMIDFKIIGSSLSGQPRSNSLKVNFGNIEPRESKLTWWEMVTTLDGTFTEFTGTYIHSSELGGAETSLIKELNTHIILREIDTGEITYDFLVDSDMDGIPDFVIDSVHGTSTEVVSVDYTVTMEPTPENPTLMISTKKVEGKWICTSVEDPYENKVPIKRVERADGKILSPQNYWMRDDRILIVDDPVQEYKITYSGITLPRITNIKPGNITAISGDTIEFNCSVTDDIGVVSVWLNYTINDWTTYNIQIMDNPYTDFYTTNLTFPDVKVIEYKIEANDEVGNLGSSGIFKMMILGYIYVPNGYPTIQTAIDAVSAGDTIIVRDGTYTENIDVTKPHLTIKSENGSANCFVQAANPNDHVFEITADNVNISGFTLKNAIGSWKAGIYLASAHCNISNNNASNNYNGIYLSSSNNNQLTDNIANSNHKYGISLSSTVNNNISCNWVVQNQQGGFHIADGSTGNIIKDNNIVTNGESLGDSWHYNFYNDQSDNVIAENNYWGTDSLTMIAASIYDGSDDPSKGMVDFEPFLTEPTPCAPGPGPALPVISNPTVIPNIGNNGDTFTWSATVTYPDGSEPTVNLSLQGLGDLNHNGYCDLNDVVAIITIWSNGSYETLTLVEQRIVDIDCDGDLDEQDCSLAEEMWENDGWLTLQMDKSGSTYTHSRILFDTNNNSVDYDYRWKITAKDSYSEVSTEVFDGPIVRSPSQPKLCTSPDPPSHDFGTVPKDKELSWSFELWNCGSDTLIWTVNDDQPWITVYPTSGSTTTGIDSVTVTLGGVYYLGLSPGTYTGHITIKSNGGSKIGTITVKVPTQQFTFLSTDNAVPITVDGTLQSSPYTASWTSGSVHSVNALSEFIAQPDCLKYIFTGWTGAITLSYTLLPPTITPGTYTANYKKQYYLTVDTEPQGIATISGEGWYDQGVMATTGSAPEEVTAGGEKYQFETWKVDGSPVSMPFNWIQLKMDNCHTVTASYQRSSPFIFQSTDNAVPITIDGTSQSSPYTASWTTGAGHTVNAREEFVAQSDCLKYLFTGWTGAITQSGTLLPPTITTGTYTANYKKQYYLTVNTEPQGIATISGEGWYDQGAMATTGSAPEEVTAGGEKYQFETWKVDGSPVSMPFNWIQLKMDNCHTVTASYQRSSQLPPTNPTLTPDILEPQTAGTSITWTASATDSDGDTLYYRFWIKGPSTGNSWAMKRDWSTDNTWTWDTNSADIGDTDISVWIRDGHHEPASSYDLEKVYYDYTITGSAPSLVAEWHFDEGSGSTVKDNTGNGNDGIIHGATWVNGIKGNALKFDGKDDYVEVQDSSSLRITGNIKVEAWVKVEELGSKYHFIVSKHYTPAGYTLFINPANKFAFEISSQHSVASTTTPELGKWYHVVGTYDQSQLKIYVNDVLENTKGCTAKLATNNQKLRIGQWSAGGYCFKGIIDEVGIST